MKYKLLCLLFFSYFGAFPQNYAYEIRINIKGAPDTAFFLAKYYFGQTVLVDSCKNLKNGVGIFRGQKALDKGVYILASQGKGRYIDFFVDDSQKFSLNAELSDIVGSIKADGSEENNQIFAYARYMTSKEKEFRATLEQSKGKSKSDSAKLVSEKQAKIGAEVQVWESEFMKRNKGTFVYDFINLKTEKTTTVIPKASNGRPDSLYQYYYYKNHYFEGVNFKDERILYTPFFSDRIKRYFDQVIVQHPDTVIREIDKILSECETGSLMFNTLVGHFTYKYETNKAMSFDQYGNCNTFEKVFVHLADQYITSGKAKGIYDEETVKKIGERVNILRNLLPGAKVSDLHMIDTTYGKQVLSMGFDTARSSQSVTYLYNKNYEKLVPLFRSLYQVNAKYTVLVFWAVDCGHCQTEIPKLHEDLEKIRNSIDVKVYAVQTKEELYKDWKKFVLEKNLNHFVHVFDPIHLNNLKENFDIQGTPVIYLLDKDKKIKAKKIAADQVVDILKNLDNIEKNLKK
ncbi:MAG TPA: thioredoxin-like domain-containing protein [Bacteroidia bacterium]|nr:thioredoxin-like domain-containing protein [Bacteroidia bacterium]